MVARISGNPQSSNTDSLGDDLLFGAAEIAHFLRRTERPIFWMLENNMIPGKKLGQRWRASKTQLRRYLTGDAE